MQYFINAVTVAAFTFLYAMPIIVYILELRARK